MSQRIKDAVRDDLKVVRHFLRKVEWKKVLPKLFLVILVLGVGLGLAGLTFFYASSRGWILRFLIWVESLKYKGIAVVAVCFLILNLPMTVGYLPLKLATGFLFGFPVGFVVTFISVVVGYSIVFLACHYFFKEKLNKLVINQGAVVDSLLEDVRAHSLKIGFLIRFTPLPLGLQNTVMAISPISFVHYLWTSALGVIPDQITFVYIGSTFRGLAAIADGDISVSWQEICMGVVAVVAITCILTLVSHITLKALRKAHRLEIEQEEAQDNQTQQPAPEVTLQVGDPDIPVQLDDIPLETFPSSSSSSFSAHDPKEITLEVLEVNLPNKDVIDHDECVEIDLTIDLPKSHHDLEEQEENYEIQPPQDPEALSSSTPQNEPKDDVDDVDPQ